MSIYSFNETQEFEEFNPHPYQGGYDIALTYGNPLPPSSAVCYPLSDAPETAVSTSAGRRDDLPDADYSPACGFPSVDLGFDAEEMGYWGPLRRAADYIFGYSQGFGERRIGVDGDGIPIYAYKMRGSDAVNVQIEEERTEKLEWRDDSERWSSTYNNLEDEKFGFDAEVDPVESVFSWKPSHHVLYDEQLYPERKWVTLSCDDGRNEANFNGNLEMAYNKHYYSGAQNVQLEAVENSFQKLSYHEASLDFPCTDSNWEPSYGDHGDEKNTFTDAYYNFERQDYQQPSDVELEPYKPTWAQYPVYYGISEEDVYAGSQSLSNYSEVYNEPSSPRSTWPTSFGEWGNEGNFCSSEHAYQTHHDDHPLELEPFKPTWMLNPNYYGSY